MFWALFWKAVAFPVIKLAFKPSLHTNPSLKFTANWTLFQNGIKMFVSSSDNAEFEDDEESGTTNDSCSTATKNNNGNMGETVSLEIGNRFETQYFFFILETASFLRNFCLLLRLKLVLFYKFSLKKIETNLVRCGKKLFWEKDKL